MKNKKTKIDLKFVFLCTLNSLIVSFSGVALFLAPFSQSLVPCNIDPLRSSNFSFYPHSHFSLKTLLLSEPSFVAIFLFSICHLRVIPFPPVKQTAVTYVWVFSLGFPMTFWLLTILFESRLNRTLPWHFFLLMM